jgi:putative MATE family efflux protein
VHRPGVTAEARERARVPGELGGRLAGLSLPRQVIALAMWPLLEQLMGFLVATVDLVIAARMSEGPERVAIMDALGLSAYVVWLMMILQGAVGTGVMALISRAAGARDQELATKGMAQGLMAGLGTGVVSALAIRLVLGFLLSALQLDEAARESALAYLAILCLICPILGMMFAATHALRAIGDTRTPFFAMMVVNVVNVALSCLFVFGPEPIGGMGVSGLAWGSVLGWLAGLLCLLVHLARLPKNENADEVSLSLQLSQLRPEWGTMKRLLRVGTPQGMEMFGMWLINCVTLRFVAGLAMEGSISAHFIAIRVESMSFLPGFAIGTAGATLVGQYLGAGNPDKAAHAVRVCWKFAAVLMGIIGLGFLIWPGVLVRMILPETDPNASVVIGRAIPLIFLCGIVQPVLATCMIMKITLRGAGATKIVMKGSFASMIFFRAIMVPVGVHFFGFDLVGIWVLMFCDITVQALVFVWVHFRGDWKSAVV